MVSALAGCALMSASVNAVISLVRQGMSVALRFDVVAQLAGRNLSLVSRRIERLHHLSHAAALHILLHGHLKICFSGGYSTLQSASPLCTSMSDASLNLLYDVGGS